jgi:hypothetical protein
VKPKGLDNLKKLEDGWYDGEQGKAPDPAGLDWLEGAIPEVFPDTYCFPMLDGRVQLEWDRKPWDIEMEVNLETHQGEYFALNIETDEEEEMVLDLDKDSSWEWLRRKLR